MRNGVPILDITGGRNNAFPLKISEEPSWKYQKSPPENIRRAPWKYQKSNISYGKNTSVGSPGTNCAPQAQGPQDWLISSLYPIFVVFFPAPFKEKVSEFLVSAFATKMPLSNPKGKLTKLTSNTALAKIPKYEWVRFNVCKKGNTAKAEMRLPFPQNLNAAFPSGHLLIFSWTKTCERPEGIKEEKYFRENPFSHLLGENLMTTSEKFGKSFVSLNTTWLRSRL